MLPAAAQAGRNFLQELLTVFTIQRAITMANGISTKAIVAAVHGCSVTSHVRPIARASSLVLRAMLETGSGLGVTTARTALFELCAISAIAPPAAVASNCISGDR